MYHVQLQAPVLGVTPHCTPMGAAGCLHGGEGRWEEEEKGRAWSKFRMQKSLQRKAPALCPRAGVGAEGFASCLSLWLLPGSQIVRRRAGEGAQELSDVVSAVTPLNKAHLSGRQQIQQDFCRPDGEG